MVSHNRRCCAKTKKGTRCKRAINQRTCIERGSSITRFCEHHWKSFVETDSYYDVVLDKLYSVINPENIAGYILYTEKDTLGKALRFHLLSESSYRQPSLAHFNASILNDFKS